MFIVDFYTIHIEMHSELNRHTHISIKDRVLSKIDVSSFPKIGDIGSVVQMDETDICRGRLITDRTSTLDDITDVLWIVGGVVEGENSQIFLVLTPEIRAVTIIGIFNQFINTGIIIRTEGSPSYPIAVSAFVSQHQIANHSTGFINENGETTNSIENIWSHFKGEYRIRNGLRRERIATFINEFFWRKRTIITRTPETHTQAFYSIL